MRDVMTAVAERPTRNRPADWPDVSACRSLVIAGNGMVGHRLCRQLVSLGVTATREVIVFGEEPRPAYDRVHLTDYFSGRNDEDLLLSPASWYGECGIDLRLGDPIVHVDRRSRTVTSASGLEVQYAHLVLATGSSPYVPPIEGTHLPGVFLYRTLADLEAIAARARQASSAAVIGGGLLGLEAARALQRLGLRIVLIEAAAALMPAQLDQPGGKALERRIEELGIEIRTSARTQRIEGRGRQRTLHLAGGDSVTADLVVIAAGIRPRAELATQCGLERATDGGVIVDDHLRSSDPDIFAIGECASHRSQVYGLAAPGYAMADALAANLAGQPAVFDPPRPTTRLKLLGIDVVTVGEPLDRGHSVQSHTAGGYRLLRVDKGRLIGALGVGPWDDFARVQDGATRRVRVWPWQIARFERTGALWRPRHDPPVGEWASDAVVCNCMHVTRGQLTAVAKTQRVVTVQALTEGTGASTLCGSCRPLLEQLAGAPSRVPARVGRALLVLSAVALVGAALLAAWEPFPFATSIQDAWRVDGLWRSALARQISGFALLGLALIASLLSVRKRWARAASAGAFPAWRIAHTVVGVLTLAALAVHTGARGGDNLNLALMTSFSAVNVLGSIAGGVTAVEQKFGPAAGRRYRAATVMAHILAVWPLPVLIAFHVLSVYYF